jgi:protein-disulfide isomerase
MVVFVDFECTFCRRLHATLRELRAQLHDSLGIVYRHFPVSRVGYAFPAAVAAECAAAQGKFAAFADLLFASQDTLPKLSFERAAAHSGVADATRFRECLTSDGSRRRVSEDIRAGRSVGVDATPTVIIGDQLVVGDLAEKDLIALVRKSASVQPDR